MQKLSESKKKHLRFKSAVALGMSATTITSCCMPEAVVVTAIAMLIINLIWLLGEDYF